MSSSALIAIFIVTATGISILLPALGLLIGFRRVVLLQIAVLPIGMIHVTGLGLAVSVVGAMLERPRAWSVLPKFLSTIWVIWFVVALIQLAAIGAQRRQAVQLAEFVMYGAVAVTSGAMFRASPALRDRVIRNLPLAAIPLAIVMMVAGFSGVWPHGIGRNETTFAIVLLGHVPLLYLYAFRLRRRSGLLILQTIFFIVAGLAESRSGVLLMSFTTAAVVVYTLGRRRFVMIALVTITLGSAVWFSGLGRMAATAVEATVESNPRSNEERLALLHASWRLVRERPVLGWGWGSIEVVLPLATETRKPRMHPHNAYAHAAVEMGVVGMLLLLTLYGEIALRAVGMMRHRNRGAVFNFSAFVALALLSMTDVVFYGASRGLVACVLLGLCSAMNANPLGRRYSTSRTRPSGSDEGLPGTSGSHLGSRSHRPSHRGQ